MPCADKAPNRWHAYKHAQQYVISYPDADPIYISQEWRTDLDIAMSRAEQISRDDTEHRVEVWFEDEGIRTRLVAQFFNGIRFQ